MGIKMDNQELGARIKTTTMETTTSLKIPQCLQYVSNAKNGTICKTNGQQQYGQKTS